MNSIIPLSAFTDNYIWVIVYGNSAIVVDPGDAAPVKKFLSENNLNLIAILITHHHFDHTGGLLQLVEENKCSVFGPKGDHIDGITDALSEGDKFSVLNLNFSVLETPGHTLDHIVFYSENTDQKILFSGDTLFSGGCGRLFEGSPLQMNESLQKISSLPDTTIIYCAHEYTQSNLSFALATNPSNRKLISHSKTVNDLRSRNEITLPTTLIIEKEINPFLRLHDKEIVKNAELFHDLKLNSKQEAFAAIRSWKDSF
ncbi:hydroxyacylglutathione hydrolase [SAR86 cluster bacterium]|nr:hydroxyacylglutathione hydrolase [SAR86 cluster bacterium]